MVDTSLNRYSIKGAHTWPEPRTSILLPALSTLEDLKEAHLLVNRSSLMYSNRSVSEPLLAIIACNIMGNNGVSLPLDRRVS